jgi:asparagine synthase (glutamine-hydrolysing)
VCGIAGWLGHVEADDNRVEQILASLHHRGPDGSAARRLGTATLLHTRLRIIDLSPSGDQPMANEDGSVWTVFNGEIYNHHELRNDLKRRGHLFRGTSDTEVLPHLYEEYDAELFARLRGMFSVAIFDQRADRLLLARDRFGIKPLFYAARGDSLAFASELNALRLVTGIDLTPDPQAIADYAAVLFVPAPATIYRGIRALEPGTFLDAQLESSEVRCARRAYHRWSLERRDDLTLETAAELADSLIERAVASQLESDVSLGALLSGGIDSSLVSAAAQRASDAQLLTFNVRAPDRGYDETWAAQAAASHIGTRHMTLDMETGAGSWETVTSLLDHAGQPFADTSLFAVREVSRAMRRHVTVALSGDGGDEGFGGYDLYWQLRLLDHFRSAPRSLALAAATIARPLARTGVIRPTLPQRLHELPRADDVTLLQALFSWLRDREHARLLADPAEVESPRRLFEPQWSPNGGRPAGRLERLSAAAAETNIRLVLPNDYLFKVDTASMRESLEIRVPLLDEDLVAFGLTLPHALRTRGRTSKVVLREVAARRLPEVVATKPKQGFAVPVDRWVDSEFKRQLRERLTDPASPVREHFRPDEYLPWIHSFAENRLVNGISRMGLYQRAIMLLSLDLALSRT